MKIRSFIPDLDGKYYRTTVAVVIDDRQYDIFVAIPLGPPSIREIDPSEDNYQECIRDIMSDGHYESAVAYKIAKRIAEALDGTEIEND